MLQTSIARYDIARVQAVLVILGELHISNHAPVTTPMSRDLLLSNTARMREALR
jgi:hypothetical protein